MKIVKEIIQELYENGQLNIEALKRDTFGGPEKGQVDMNAPDQKVVDDLVQVAIEVYTETIAVDVPPKRLAEALAEADRDVLIPQIIHDLAPHGYLNMQNTCSGCPHSGSCSTPEADDED